MAAEGTPALAVFRVQVGARSPLASFSGQTIGDYELSNIARTARARASRQPIRRQALPYLVENNNDQEKATDKQRNFPLETFPKGFINSSFFRVIAAARTGLGSCRNRIATDRTFNHWHEDNSFQLEAKVRTNISSPRLPSAPLSPSQMQSSTELAEATRE